jgi:carbon-monoxide dehydrogenase medium subunit
MGVFPSQFAYHRPSSVEEAVQLLQQDPDAKILAGGHSLLPAMKLRLATPSALVDLNRIDSLRSINVNGDVRIGAMTTYEQIYEADSLNGVLPILRETIYNLGDRQVQARGTLGGSLAHSDPGADLTSVVLALNGSVTAVGPNGSRSIPIDELFVDLFTTSLAPDEVLTEIQIPRPQGRTGMAYIKHPHPASGYAVVGVAAVVTVGDDGNVSSARIAVTGATSKAERATAAEQALIGQPLNADTIAQAAAVAADGLEINGDHYASADYRRHLVTVYAKRALERAAGQVS